MWSEDLHQRGPMSFEIIKKLQDDFRTLPVTPPSSYGSLRLLTHLPSLSWPHFLNCHTYLWYIIIRGVMMLFAKLYRKISSETILKLLVACYHQIIRVNKYFCWPIFFFHWWWLFNDDLNFRSKEIKFKNFVLLNVFGALWTLKKMSHMCVIEKV